MRGDIQTPCNLCPCYGALDRRKGHTDGVVEYGSTRYWGQPLDKLKRDLRALVP